MFRYNNIGIRPWKEAQFMPKIVVRDKESIEDVLRRFKRDVSRSGNLQEAKKRQYYLKPSDVRKQKRQEARKKFK